MYVLLLGAAEARPAAPGIVEPTSDLIPLVAAAFVVVVTIMLLLIKPKKKPEVTATVMVSHLTVYPVKSCKGVKLAKCALDATCGFQDDRRYSFVDAHGVFLSQRRFPKLCLVAPTYPVGGALSLKAPGMPFCSVPVDETGPLKKCRIWADAVQAVDQGEAAAKWISDHLKTPGLRLVRFPVSSKRRVDAKYAKKACATAFSDGFPILLANHDSLADLNMRLAQNRSAPVPMDRFRPNIVVAGALAWSEDGWGSLTRAGDGLVLDVVKPCARCKIPTVDQATGRTGAPSGVDDLGGGPGSMEPNRTLQEFRSGAALADRSSFFAEPKRAHDVFFGQNLVHFAPGAEVAVGDRFQCAGKAAGGCVVC
jgi:hypothetical protein